jgi:hypothetical protein
MERMPRFVLLRHECPAEYRPSHWDLMFETEGELTAWELAALPNRWCEALDIPPSAGNDVVVTPLAPHRLAYLEYEGEISGGRGRVRRIEKGEYTLVSSRNDALHFTLAGKHLQGTASIALQGKQWLLTVAPQS